MKPKPEKPQEIIECWDTDHTSERIDADIIAENEWWDDYCDPTQDGREDKETSK